MMVHMNIEMHFFYLPAFAAAFTRGGFAYAEGSQHEPENYIPSWRFFIFFRAAHANSVLAILPASHLPS